MIEKPKICFVVSTLMTVKAFLDNHIRVLSATFDVFIVANLTEKDYEYLHSLPIKGFKHIEINRKIHLKNDLKATIELARYFRKEKFYAIHSVTPKAGLINALAGKIAKIKHRIHIFTGQVWANREGVGRFLLKMLDKVIVKLNTIILVDGKSQQEFLINEGVLKEGKSIVLAKGSIAGVNTEMFSPNADYRQQVRNKIGVKENKIVFIFLGRLCRDKGINELLKAFSLLEKEYDHLFLLLVGPQEEDFSTIIKDKYPNLIERQNYFLYGLTHNPAEVLNAGDVFCLPSYREGFGVSVIEAASVGLATIVSDTYGLRDSIINDVTGLVCMTANVNSLLAKMKYYIEHPEIIKLFGSNGRIFIENSFNQKDVSQAWIDFYKSLT